MAEFGQRGAKGFDVGEQTVYTSDSDSTIVLSILCANLTGNNTDVTVRQRDGNGAGVTNLAQGIAIPNAASLEILSNKYILPSGNRVTVETTISGSLAYSMSFVVV